VGLAGQHQRLAADPPSSHDLRDWTLGKGDLGGRPRFTSAANRCHLGAGGDGYILGEKLRSGSPKAAVALARPGRYQDVTANLRVKEVKVSEHERFGVCYNPEAADRDAAVRANLVARLEAMIAGSDRLAADKRAELRGVISTRPGLHRFLRVTPKGLLRVDLGVDAAAVAADAKPDGKYLLRTAGPHLSAEDIALGYEQLLEVERGWPDMTGPRPAPGFPSARRPHPRPRTAVLARAAARLNH
jgi:hypothetical protein